MDKAGCLMLLLFAAVSTCGAADGDSPPLRPVSGGLFQEKLLNANPNAGAIPVWERVIPTYYFADRGEQQLTSVSPFLKAQYRSVCPGIDRAYYGDDYWLEEVFRLSPGADPARIRLAIRGIDGQRVDEAGDIVVGFAGGEAIMSRPVIVSRSKEGQSVVPCSYTVNDRLEIGMLLPDALQAKWSKAADVSFNIVAGGEQANGPAYDFYLSKFEVMNDEFMKFLNNAEANTNNAQGANMFFDGEGNVWINPEMKKGRDEMFAISRSRLIYNSRNPVGRHYEHVADTHGDPIFSRYPVTGVSWYGTLKYCNWLTIAAGRGEGERCYAEGTNGLDWAPVTATNWANGKFEDDCRDAWLHCKGFRLPMACSFFPRLTVGAYGEFHKASVWNGATNVLFGFGRNTVSPLDANYRREDALSGPLSVGFFDGTNCIGKKITHENLNYYGVYDLSGNVEEWLSDFAVDGSVSERSCAGGSWADRLGEVSRLRAVSPSSAEDARGIRLVTTYMPEDELLIHILFRFYMEPIPPVPVKPPEEGVEKEEPGEQAKPGTEEETAGISGTLGLGTQDREGLVYTNLPKEGMAVVSTTTIATTTSAATTTTIPTGSTVATTTTTTTTTAIHTPHPQSWSGL